MGRKTVVNAVFACEQENGKFFRREQSGINRFKPRHNLALHFQRLAKHWKESIHQ